MSDITWDDLQAWFQQVPSTEDLNELTATLTENPEKFLELLKEKVAQEPLLDGTVAAAAAITFWKIHGLPFENTPHHNYLLNELLNYLPQDLELLSQIIDKDDYITAAATPPIKGGTKQTQVANISDYLVCQGEIIDPERQEDILTLKWLTDELGSTPACYLSESRYESYQHLLGGRNRLVTVNHTVQLHSSESLQEDEVQLVEGSVKEVIFYIPPSSCHMPQTAKLYNTARKEGLPPLEALSEALS